MELSFQYTAFEKCLKSTSSFAETTYHNLCDGSITTVSSGFWDYVGNVGLAGILFGGVIALCALAIKVIIY